MQGDLLHNYLGNETKGTLTNLDWRVWPEFCVEKGAVKNYLDLFATKAGLAIGFEIETTARHVLDNCRKAELVGIPLWIIVPNRRVLKSVANKLVRQHIRPAGHQIKLLLLSQLKQELTKYIALFIAAYCCQDRKIEK
jgi:hypothetical protein